VSLASFTSVITASPSSSGLRGGESAAVVGAGLASGAESTCLVLLVLRFSFLGGGVGLRDLLRLLRAFAGEGLREVDVLRDVFFLESDAGFLTGLALFLSGEGLRLLLGSRSRSRSRARSRLGLRLAGLGLVAVSASVASLSGEGERVFEVLRFGICTWTRHNDRGSE